VETCGLLDGESALMNYLLHFLKNTKAHKGCKNKKNDHWSRFFLVEGWNIEGLVTKVVEWIVMNVGLLILHKTKV